MKLEDELRQSAAGAPDPPSTRATPPTAASALKLARDTVSGPSYDPLQPPPGPVSPVHASSAATTAAIVAAERNARRSRPRAHPGQAFGMDSEEIVVMRRTDTMMSPSGSSRASGGREGSLLRYRARFVHCPAAKGCAGRRAARLPPNRDRLVHRLPRDGGRHHDVLLITHHGRQPARLLLVPLGRANCHDLFWRVHAGCPEFVENVSVEDIDHSGYFIEHVRGRLAVAGGADVAHRGSERDRLSTEPGEHARHVLGVQPPTHDRATQVGLLNLHFDEGGLACGLLTHYDVASSLDHGPGASPMMLHSRC